MSNSKYGTYNAENKEQLLGSFKQLPTQLSEFYKRTVPVLAHSPDERTKSYFAKSIEVQRNDEKRLFKILDVTKDGLVVEFIDSDHTSKALLQVSLMSIYENV